jgi:hypothetical protein
MAGLSGAKGAITIPGTEMTPAQLLLVTRWTASLDRDIHDVSSFDAAQTNERTKLGGMVDLKGTCEGTIDGGAMPLIAMLQLEDTTAVAGFILATKTGQNFTFPGITSNLSLDVPKGGVQTFTMAFESSGVIVRNTA